ncbi:pirin family protein [Nocardioides nanhaiensis]|uniref:pirin family protein n=1 Tax=Nocardioides nanhaiensis TaxID=1476871 RepID=UPI0031EE6FDC
MTVEIRRGTARFVDREAGRRTQHAFSFGAHYDPQRLELGPMVCHDDHLLGAGRGFETHRHSDLLIVSWVVEGALVHTGSAAGEVTLGPGSVAVLSAGSDGVDHAEHAASSGPCRFVQVWLRPGEESEVLVQPGDYQHATPDVVPDTAQPLAQPRLDAVLWLVRLSGDPAVAVELPTAPLVHAYVATGALLRSSLAEPLATGDAFVMTDEPAHTVSAGVPTDLLVWTFHDGPAPVFLHRTGAAGHWTTHPGGGRDLDAERATAASAADDRPPLGDLRL